MVQLISWYGPSVLEGWDSTKVYRSDTGETGTYNLIATVTPITTVSYWDTTGDSSAWYKISFYKTSGAIEGPKSAAFYASAAATHYVDPSTLRKFLGYATTDFPTDEEATLLLDQVHTQLASDVGGTSPITTTAKLKLLALLLGGSFVCRYMASRALSKGYISVSLEGGSIMKAHDALMRMADYWFEKYQEQLAKDTVDYTFTKYWDSTVDSVTTGDIKDTMNGVTDGLDYQNTYMPSVNKRAGR